MVSNRVNALRYLNGHESRTTEHVIADSGQCRARVELNSF